MTRGLYFIPMLERALKEPDPAAALVRAFEQIDLKGAYEPYTEGHRNFLRFMTLAWSHRDAVTRDNVYRLLAEWALGPVGASETQDRSLLDVIRSEPRWKTDYEAFCDELAIAHRAEVPDPTIEVVKDEQKVGEVHFDRVPGCQALGDIAPGDYTLKLLNTGWIIWHGELTSTELICTDAYGDVDLCLAAGLDQTKPTDEKDLLGNNRIILRTYAGLERGSIEIELMR